MSATHHRCLLAAVPAALISLALFIVMQRLIAGPALLQATPSTASRITFAPIRLPEPEPPAPPVVAPEPIKPPPVPTEEPVERAFDRPRSNLDPLAEGPGLPFDGPGEGLQPIGATGAVGRAGSIRSAIRPVYPGSALLRGIEGRVIVELEIDENGRVRQARVVSASPPRVFDRAALKAVQGWRFWPGAAMVIRQEIVFSLE